MNYDCRFSYNLTIPIMEIRLITMKYGEMRHMKTSLKKIIQHSCSLRLPGERTPIVMLYTLRLVEAMLELNGRKLQKLQNRTARVVTNSPFDHTSLPLISKLGWLTVKEMIDFETACMVYKALHGLAPPYMKSMFHKLSESCNRTLRNTSTDLRIPLCKTSNGQRSFSYRGVTVWNQLSLEIKTAPSLAAFKTKLKSFLKDQRG